MGRTQTYRNAAERQKAYRERKKPQAVTENPYGELIAEVEQRIETLRASVTKCAAVGRSAEIWIGKNADYAKLQDGHSLFTMVNPVIVRHMVRTGQLVEIRQTPFDIVYQLRS